MTVLVFGSINLDLTAYVPRLPTPGETLFGSAFISVPGGKGFNQAVASGRLGARTRFIGRIGDDPFGAHVLQLAAGEPVDMANVTVDDRAGTGLAIISVDEQGENAIVVISGANMALDDDDVARCVALMDDAQLLMLQLESPLAASLTAARAARARGLKVILDPAPAMELPDEAYRLANVITPNEVETDRLTGLRPTTPDEAMQAAVALRNRGVETAIVKLGAQGAAFAGADGAGFVAAFAVDAIDTVAAGDAFNGALAVALAEGRETAAAVRFAAAAGALATTKSGAMPAMPLRAQVERLLSERAP